MNKLANTIEGNTFLSEEKVKATNFKILMQILYWPIVFSRDSQHLCDIFLFWVSWTSSIFCTIEQYPSSVSQYLQYSMAVRRTTSVKGTSWQKTSQMSIILMSEVGGKPSILLIKMVVKTSMVVKFTLKAASKKIGLKNVVAKVIAVRRREGK